MDIYIKTFNSQSESPAAFTLSSNIGSITPSTASLNELLDGKIFTLSNENATQVTLSAQGFESKAVNINKEAANCFQTSAANYIEGNTRPTNPEGTAAPFRTGNIESTSIENIFDLNIGDQITLQIYENLVSLTIFNKISEPDEIIIESSGHNSEFFLASKNILTNEINFFYQNTANTGWVQYSSTDSKIKEWVSQDFITFCTR